MLIYSQTLPSIFSLLFFLLPITNSLTSPNPPKDHLLINFGLSKSSTPPVDDGGAWQSDLDYIHALPSTAFNTTSTATAVGAPTPYNMARIFRAPTTYLVPLSSWGPKLLRLYFPPSSTSYDIIDPKNSFLSLTVDGFHVLRNFSAYAVVANANTNPNTNAPVSNGLVREIYIEAEEGDKALNLTFSPSNPGGFGFINGLEVISVHDGLYVNRSSANMVPYLHGGLDDYLGNPFSYPNYLVMENIIRLNVGGSNVDPHNDSGFRRTWYNDEQFLLSAAGSNDNNNPSFTLIYNDSGIDFHYTTSTPAYIAPELVYLTMRSMGPYYPNLKVNKNLTWLFEVDVGFNYILRLHFCELIHNNEINRTSERLFFIYINNQKASDDFNVFGLTGGSDIPMYRDFVTFVDADVSNNSSTSKSRGLLSVALLPDPNSVYHDVLLNGLEIFKLGSSNGSLAAPNPPLPFNSTPVQSNSPSSRKSSHHLVLIIVSILGAFIVSLLTFTCIIMCRKQKFINTMSKDDESKSNWVSTFHDSGSNATTTTSLFSSLPSDLCRRFSLAQIKVATCDFDEKSIIGTGGFGKVYKGSIDDGAIVVAVKRLNTYSNQGAREFQTEIEMLSRLRHVHLVSLIGYCDDQGEMILVYEYMSRGTLRDHLLYKNPEKNNNSPLSWKQRLNICVGSARGLHYLHAGAKELIIHRDVKSTNILLDDKWTAKVSDFGLSKVGPTPSETSATYVSTVVKGSIGYLDPEYYRRKQLTEKSDVYSFGVVLFEILCARPAINPNLPKKEVNLALWAQSHCRNGTLHTILDPNLTGQIAPECLRKFGEIAKMCVCDHGSERPSMGDVVWGLEFALQLQETAEKNNTSDDPLREITDSTSFELDAGDGHDPSYNDASTMSRENFFETKIVDFDTEKLIDSSRTTTTSNLSNSPINMNSGSVFSEIIDPQAR